VTEKAIERNTDMDASTHDRVDADRLAALCKALAHPARIRIVERLRQLHQCVCGDLVDALPLAQSTVSQHLKILKSAGVVMGEIEGPRTCYCLNPLIMREFKTLVDQLLRME
jgi:ArsR family transcriptional regulator